MAGFAGKFDSVRQDWPTPQSLFDEIDKEFSFTLDAAASSENTKVLDNYFTAEDSALTKSWGDHTVWLNPPYGAKSGSLQEWVRKAHSESTSGATVVMLIPARTNTNWFHDLALGKGEVRFVRGRPKFGDATHGLPQPLCYVIFRPALAATPTPPTLSEDLREILASLPAGVVGVLKSDRFKLEGWELPVPSSNPLIRKLVDSGLFRLSDSRCGFEAVKDGWIKPTPAGLIARAALARAQVSA